MLNEFTVRQANAKPEQIDLLAYCQSESAAIHYAKEVIRRNRSLGDDRLQVEVVSYGNVIWESKNEKEVQS